MLTGKGKIAAVVLGVTLCQGGQSVRPACAAEMVTDVGSAETHIFATLGENTTVEFIEEPLIGVVHFLVDFHDMQIQIDEPALKDMGLGTDEPISKSLDGVSLHSALNLILRDLGLDWTIANEVLLITSPEVAESTMVTRVYDVGDLILARDNKGQLWRDFDSMIHMLTSTIDPHDWEEFGGPGSIADFEFRGAAGLVIRHTPKVHQKVARLLNDLAKLAAKYGSDVYPDREPSGPTPPPACQSADPDSDASK
jgi:hypothetical protein